MVAGTAEVCFMPVTFGVGVLSAEDARSLLLAGADKVAVNSAAVARPELIADIADRFGSQCAVGSIDARRVEDRRWEIFTHGGRKPTGIDALDHAVRLAGRSEEHTSELQSLMRTSYAVFCLKKKKNTH